MTLTVGLDISHIVSSLRARPIAGSDDLINCNRQNDSLICARFGITNLVFADVEDQQVLEPARARTGQKSRRQNKVRSVARQADCRLT